MAGRKKKSAPKKKVQAAESRYTIPPPSPVKTRSSAPTQGSPPRVQSPKRAASPASLISSEISALETRFDTRMSQMESNLRASLTSALTASVSSVVPSPTVLASPSLMPPPLAPPAPAPTDVPRVAAAVARASRSSSASSSSSAASGNRSSSSGSSYSRSRDRRSRDKHRRSRRSPRRGSRRTSRNKHGKYTTLRYVPEHKSVTTYERLVLANLHMMLKFYKKERDIKGMLKHSILLAQKADADVFHNEALISYNESIKTAAGEDGIKAFSKLDPAAIIKHLSYDGTKAARAAKSRNSNRPTTSSVRASGNTTSACFKFNFASGGCRRSKCSYPHVCSACSGPGHVNADCPNVDRAHEKSSRK